MIKKGVIILLVCIIAVSPYLSPANVYAESPFDGIAMFILERIDDVDNLFDVFNILKWGTKNRDEEANKNAKDFEKKLIEKDAIDCLSQDVFKYCYMDHPNICKQEGIENKEDWMELPENVRLEIIKNNSYFLVGRQAWNEGLDGFGVVHDGTFTDPLKNRNPAEKLFFEKCPPKSSTNSLKANPRAQVSKIDPINTVKPITATIAKPKKQHSMRISGATCQGRRFSFVVPEGYSVEEVPTECLAPNNESKQLVRYELSKENSEGYHRIQINLPFWERNHGATNVKREALSVAGNEGELVVFEDDIVLEAETIEQLKEQKSHPSYASLPDHEKKILDYGIQTGKYIGVTAVFFPPDEKKVDFPTLIMGSTSLNPKYVDEFKSMLKTVEFISKN